MNLTFYKNDPFFVSRIAQLSQRTNQFNLTTIRYNEDEVQSKMNSENFDVIAVKLEDRLGDLGIIGAIIIDYTEQKKAHINSFMLSCRALGRNIEDSIMSYIFKIANLRGVPVITSEYRRTNKNLQVKEFYDKRLFEITQNTDDELKKYEITSKFFLTYLPPSYVQIKEESEWKRRPVDMFKRVKVSKGVGSKELKKKMRKKYIKILPKDLKKSLNNLLIRKIAHETFKIT
jgi:predicted enzyme involved in methoxymalonyl-ACP biosynthesis